MTKATATSSKAVEAPRKTTGGRARAVARSSAASPLPARPPLPERVELPAGYKPSGKEEYMSAKQLEYFRQKLLTWRSDLVEESKQTIDNLREEVRDVGDEAERATRETENSLELRTRDRYRKLIGKIDKALKRVDEGDYGYCEETGEEIGIERLEARPIATLCLDAQERWEHRQKLMGD
ncbi:MAG: RNA polymerase-binding protein DksA [Lysobacteraceae bacterium]